MWSAEGGIWNQNEYKNNKKSENFFLYSPNCSISLAARLRHSYILGFGVGG